MHVLKQILTTEVGWQCRHCDKQNKVTQFTAGDNLVSCVGCQKGAIVPVVIKGKAVAFGTNHDCLGEMENRKNGKEEYFIEELK